MIGKILCSMGFHSMYYIDILSGVFSPQKCKRCSHTIGGVDWERLLPEVSTDTPMPKCKPHKRG